MTLRRIDNVGIVVEDLPAAIAFFTELGMQLLGQAPVEGEWADKMVGLDGMQVVNAMLVTPDGGCRLELSQFHRPAAVHAPPKAPNTIGFTRVMFAVDDIHDTVARLRKHGAELVREVVQYEDYYLLCNLRGPSGIIIALAQELKAFG